MEKQYFDGIKVGDKVYRLIEGECEVSSIGNGSSIIAGTWIYDMNGRLGGSAKGLQVAFWSDPKVSIIAPPKPKRMVTKTFNAHINGSCRHLANGITEYFETVEGLPSLLVGDDIKITAQVEE